MAAGKDLVMKGARTARAGCLVGAALFLVQGSMSTPGYAAIGQAGASRTGHANVFVEPVVSGTLWFDSLDPALGSFSGADAEAKIYAGLVKQVYDDRTGHFTIAPDLAAALPSVSS